MRHFSKGVLEPTANHTRFFVRPIIATIMIILLGLGTAARAGDSTHPSSTEMESDDGQWVMPAKNYASTRFSGLDQINIGNAINLKAAWTFSTGVNRGQEAAPIVVSNTMYIVTPFPNLVY